MVSGNEFGIGNYWKCGLSNIKYKAVMCCKKLSIINAGNRRRQDSTGSGRAQASKERGICSGVE